jgi:hypothetical protein
MPILWLASSKIFTPTPLTAHRVCTPRLWCRGRKNSLGGEGGGGSIIWKTPGTALYSVHPQNVRFQNVRFQNVRFQNVRFQNVRFTKCQVYKTSGFNTSGFKTFGFKTSIERKASILPVCKFDILIKQKV